MIANNIEKQLSVSENRKVWLKSGGFITIDKTEALTAIDVNSAKFIEKKTLEDTAFSINKEAAIEIAKQIRLRDIGGIIVIDFIDMNEEKNKKELVSLFAEEIKKERMDLPHCCCKTGIFSALSGRRTSFICGKN